MLVVGLDATVREVAAVGFPDLHFVAGCSPPHLKQACLKLHPKHLSPWWNFQQNPRGKGCFDCRLNELGGLFEDESLVMWCACNHNSQCTSSQGKRDF